jgi:hypothetical protein
MRLEETSGRGPGVVDQEQRTRPFRACLVDVVEVLSAVASPSCVRTGIPGATPELRLGPLRGDVMSPGYRTERFLHGRLALPAMRFRPDGLHVRLRPDSYDIPCPFRSRITRVAGRPHNCGKGQPLAIAARPDGPDDRLGEGDQVAAGFVGDGSAGSEATCGSSRGGSSTSRKGSWRQESTHTEARRHGSSSTQWNSGPWMCPLPSGTGMRITARAGSCRANIWRDAVRASTARGSRRACAGDRRYPENVRVAPP